MKKIGILGGTFDPPHNAHYEIARRAIVQFQLERVIFIPSGTPWQKDSKTSFEDRYKMTNLLIQDNNLFELSDIEKSEKNPWKANSLEWQTPQMPPEHGNWGKETPKVYRWPYDFSVPGAKEDYIPQNQPPSEIVGAKVEKT